MHKILDRRATRWLRAVAPLMRSGKSIRLEEFLPFLIAAMRPHHDLLAAYRFHLESCLGVCRRYAVALKSGRSAKDSCWRARPVRFKAKSMSPLAPFLRTS